MSEDRRVLVIDDDQSVLRLIKTHLGAAGYRVDTASDGETGLQMVEEFRPRLVILDLLLPGIDGFVVCRRIRENPHLTDTSILMMTAVYLSQEDMMQGLRIGADDYLLKPDVILSKPVHLKDLKDAVDAVFQNRTTPQIQDQARDRILVVDDDEKNLRLMKMRFASEGFEVDTAVTGQIALEKLEKFPAHLLLMDIKMPAMSGLDVLKKLRERGDDTPVVMMTAHGSESIAVEAFGFGADDYLIKPFDSSMAVHRVSQLIEKFRLKKSRDQLTERLKKISCDLVNQVNHLEIQNQRLEEAYAKVRGLSDFNRRFIKSLSQELRAPLAMILSFLSLFRDTPPEKRDPESEKESISIIYKTAFRLEINLANLLYISRIQADALNVISGAMELEPVLEDTLELARKSLGREDTLISWYPERKVHRISGDTTIFKDVLINLLDNCIQRMEGPGEISVEILEALNGNADGGTGVWLRIRDNGSWFSEGDLTPSSVQELNPETMKEGTEAIRLNLCRHLARLMHWEMETGNRPVGGGEIFLRMPPYAG